MLLTQRIARWSVLTLVTVLCGTADAQMQADSAVRGCSGYSEWAPVSQPDAGSCFSYCSQNGANACEWNTGGACYAEFGTGCYVQGGFGGWYAAVLSGTGGGSSLPAGYVGCFTDDGNRALPAAQSGSFGLQACTDRCRSLGYAYSGSQWYDQCFCGNSLGYTQVSDGECNTPCYSGGGYCGGGWRNSVTATGYTPPAATPPPSWAIAPEPIPAYGRDADKDEIDDHTEYDIARALLPRILFSTEDNSLAPWLPKPIVIRVRYLRTDYCGVLRDYVMVNYVVMYQQDGGWVGGLAGHAGDNEMFGVLGHWNGAAWEPIWTTAVAHENTTCEKHSTASSSPGNNTIWAGNNKHGNFASLSACADQDYFCGNDCAHSSKELPLRFFNPGEEWSHVMDNLGEITSLWNGYSFWSGKFMDAGPMIDKIQLYPLWMPPAPNGCGNWKDPPIGVAIPRPSPSVPPDQVPTMTAGQSLYANQYVTSQDGRFVLIYQGDGNLVLYLGSEPLWSSGTCGTSPGVAVMQGDGNFVVYDAAWTPVWNSGTWSYPGAYLTVTNEGRLLIYTSAGQLLRVYGTGGR